MRFSESTKTGLLPSVGSPSGMRIRHKCAVAETLDTAGASDPQVSFPVFKQGRYGLVRRASLSFKDATPLGIEPQEPARVRAHPDVPVAIPSHRQSLEMVERCWYARRGEFAPVPAHDAVVRADPQIPIAVGKQTIDLQIGKTRSGSTESCRRPGGRHPRRGCPSRCRRWASGPRKSPETGADRSRKQAFEICRRGSRTRRASIFADQQFPVICAAHCRDICIEFWLRTKDFRIRRCSNAVRSGPATVTTSSRHCPLSTREHW